MLARPALLLFAAVPAVCNNAHQIPNDQIPRWATSVPDASKPAAGLRQIPSNVSKIRSVYKASPSVGTYNHGPMIVQYGGLGEFFYTFSFRL